jgi:hypothetical protein
VLFYLSTFEFRYGSRISELRFCNCFIKWERVKVYTKFWWVNPRKGDHLKDQNVDGRIILKWIFDNWDGGVDWIDLAEDRDRCRAVMNAVVNRWVP